METGSAFFHFLLWCECGHLKILYKIQNKAKEVVIFSISYQILTTKIDDFYCGKLKRKKVTKENPNKVTTKDTAILFKSKLKLNKYVIYHHRKG